MRQERVRREKLALRQLRVARFCQEKVVPALESLRPELESHGRQLEIRQQGNVVHFTVFHRDGVEFRHSVLASRRSKRARSSNGYYRDSEGYGRDVDQVYTLRDLRWTGKETIIRRLVVEFRKAIATTGQRRL
jgi:hypothetical protein